MGKVAPLAVAIILSASTAFATDLPSAFTAPENTESILAPPSGQYELCKVTSSEKNELGRRGCCSWHGGVCGCSDSRVVCCDGSYSPTCTCHHDDKPSQI